MSLVESLGFGIEGLAPLKAQAEAVEYFVRHFEAERMQSERWGAHHPCQQRQGGDHAIVDHLAKDLRRSGSQA